MRVALAGPAGPFHLDASVGIAQGTFTALIGPSGAGKTTLLRLLAGLARPHAGYLSVGGEVWCDTRRRLDVPTRHRPLGFVFQDYALFPNMTVRGNVEYALGRERTRSAVDDLLELVGLEGLQHAHPARLSGGQKQRLALIRALARRPALLLLDEPLSALDPVMRQQLQAELKRLHRVFGTTTFLVSHDTAEILRMADRVLRMDEGRIIFDGAPPEAFGASASPDSIRLVGEHVDGPDDEGYSRILVDGRIQRVRYRRDGDVPAAGDVVVLQVDQVATTRLSAANGHDRCPGRSIAADRIRLGTIEEAACGAEMG